MKENYIKPVVEIVKFETEDIIITSPGLTVGGSPADDDGWSDIIQ